MKKWVSSKNVNLIAKIQYKVNISSKTKWREDHAKIIFKLSGWFQNPIGEANIEKKSKEKEKKNDSNNILETNPPLLSRASGEWG